MARRLLFPVVIIAGAHGATLTITAGVFRFEATDCYYPNFFTEAGFRGRWPLPSRAVTI